MWQFQRALIYLTLIAVISVLATPSLAQRPAWDDPLFEAAKEYAADNHVDVTEATRRLNLQLQAGYLNEALATNLPKTFAGLWIQHQPEFRIKVFLTQGDLATLQPYISSEASTSLPPLIDIQKANLSLAQLEADQEQASKILHQLPVSFDSGLNILKQQVEVYVTDATAYNQTLAAKNIALPSTIKIVPVTGLIQSAADIYGGLGISGPTSGCTTGFTVRQANGQLGVLTAGHCENDESYNGVNLPFIAEAYNGPSDVQVNRVAGLTAQPWVKNNSGGYHAITLVIYREQMGLNSFVCKCGNVTHYTCGYIVDKNVAPSYMYEAGRNPLPTFIRVHRDGQVLALQGDSGGPWYIGSWALGIHVGNTPFDSTGARDGIYMASNYWGVLGITPLLGP